MMTKISTTRRRSRYVVSHGCPRSGCRGDLWLSIDPRGFSVEVVCIQCSRSLNQVDRDELLKQIGESGKEKRTLFRR
jgi:hypothetical protein